MRLNLALDEMLPSRALQIYVPKGFTNICMNLGQFAYLLACLGIVAKKREAGGSRKPESVQKTDSVVFTHVNDAFE